MTLARPKLRLSWSVDDEYWLVIDDVLGTGYEDVALHWHLPDYKYQVEGEAVTLETPQGPCRIHLCSPADNWSWSVHRGVEGDGERAGWQSLYYGVREPALTISARAQTKLPTRFATLVSLGTSCTMLEVDPSRVIRWRSGDGPTTFVVGLTPPRPDHDPVVFLRRDGYNLGPSVSGNTGDPSVHYLPQRTIPPQEGE
ncbi:MAG TPA: heparinase II/III family protein [Hyphomicrobiaceae bacterium]|nr:heparinase II/III family protein [Hyphomicrobiaceae bacterium]